MMIITFLYFPKFSYADSYIFGGQMSIGTGFSKDKKNATNILLGAIGIFRPLYLEITNSYLYYGKRNNIELHFYHFNVDLGYQISQLFGYKIGFYISVPLKKNITDNKLLFGFETGLELFISTNSNNSVPIFKIGIISHIDLLKSVGDTHNVAFFLNLGMIYLK